MPHDPDYDLIVLDRMLPGNMDGARALCRTKKEQRPNPSNYADS